MKVVDVFIHVTCLEEDALAVQSSLNRWFCENETALVQRPKVGGIAASKPRASEPWMKETLCPEDAEEEL